MNNPALSLALDLPPFSLAVTLPTPLAVLDFSNNSSITWDNTGTPSIASIKYANNSSLSASAGAKSTQPIADSINGRQAARFDGGDDYLQFASRLTGIKTVVWIARIHATLGWYGDTWLGNADSPGVSPSSGGHFLDSAFTPASWNTNWILNGNSIAPQSTLVPIGSNFSLIMQNTVGDFADYISKDRTFTDRGMPIVLGKICFYSEGFSGSQLQLLDQQLRTEWNF